MAGAFSPAFSPAFTTSGDWLQLLWPEDKRSGPLIPMIEGTPHQLWGYRGRKPQWPWTIIVRQDWSVEQFESPTFGTDTSDESTARFVLRGGTDVRVEVGSPLHTALVGAGFEFRPVEGPRP